MFIKKTFMTASLVLGAAIVTSTFDVSESVAKEVKVTYQVSSRGLDLHQPEGARKLYGSLQHAARVVCTHGMRVDLTPLADEQACYEKALGEAVRSVNVSLLTQDYLETHTLREAAMRGIEVPLAMAAK